MALTYISSDNKPTYLALSTDIVSSKIPHAGMIGKTIYLTDSAEWKIILPDLTLADYIFP